MHKNGIVFIFIFTIFFILKNQEKQLKISGFFFRFLLYQKIKKINKKKFWKKIKK
jgi:hypothetical protein